MNLKLLKSPKVPKLLIWTVLVLGLVFGISRLSGERVTSEFWGRVFPVSPLKGAVEGVLQGKQGHYGVVVESLHDTEGFSLNDKDIFLSASLYKLVLMAAVLQEVEDGTLKISDTLSAESSYLQGRLGSVDSGYEAVTGTVKYTIEEALRRVATISDNYAAIMLTDHFGEEADDDLEQTARRLGMADTHFGEELTTTASDVAQFFRLLYLGKVVSAAASGQIIDDLAASRLSNRIPALLPPELKIAHKTGELPRLRHDGGIVFLEGKPYLIVMLSDGLKDENLGIETLAQLSQVVFKYFNAKSVAETKKE